MKTKDELTKLAFRISGLVDGLKNSEAVTLLDDLYTEGALDITEAVIPALHTTSSAERDFINGIQQGYIHARRAFINSAGGKSSFQTAATMP